MVLDIQISIIMKSKVSLQIVLRVALSMFFLVIKLDFISYKQETEEGREMREWIVRNVKFFTDVGMVRKYQDNILYATYLQLSDGRIFEEPNSHWYMCDCLGAEI